MILSAQKIKKILPVSFCSICRGISTYFPIVEKRIIKSTRGTNSARYCYAIWMRHLLKLQENGLTSIPKIIAELGPGDTLGIGLAAMIS